eukprot:5805609-Karenia_brevis.AAC.1
MPTPQDAMPIEIDGQPVEKRTLVVPNSVMYDEERARELGVQEMVVPAPIQDHRQGNAETTWRALLVQHQQRFHPGTEDPEVLQAIHGFPDVNLLDGLADLKWRRELPEPGAGMPIRP